MQSTMPFPRNTLPPQMRRAERSPIDFAVIFFVLLLLTLVGSSITWQFWHVSRIYGGVQVSGVDLGGLTRAAALRELTEYQQAYPAPAVTLQYGEQQWPIPPAHLQTSRVSDWARG
jgi:hypothetical protein